MQIRTRAYPHYVMILPIYTTEPFYLNNYATSIVLAQHPKTTSFSTFFSKMPNLRAEKIFLENLTILAKLTFQALARGVSRFSVRWAVFES